jgi:hypothetical protein
MTGWPPTPASHAPILIARRNWRLSGRELPLSIIPKRLLSRNLLDCCVAFERHVVYASLSVYTHIRTDCISVIICYLLYTYMLFLHCGVYLASVYRSVFATGVLWIARHHGAPLSRNSMQLFSPPITGPITSWTMGFCLTLRAFGWRLLAWTVSTIKLIGF